MAEATFQAEVFVVRSPPPLRAGDKFLELSGFALQRSRDELLEPSWQLLADLGRTEALELEGELAGVTAVALVQMPAGKPVRLVLAPEPALSAQLERLHWEGSVVLGSGLLDPSVFEAATRIQGKELIELREGSDWG